MKTTNENITNEQIESLKASAEQAGDVLQVAICKLALGENAASVEIYARRTLDTAELAKFYRIDSADAARRECLRVIREGGERC